MITRVTMGHTGRMIYKGPNMSIAFIAIIAAALTRSLGVIFNPSNMLLWIDISGGLWILAFGMFVWRLGIMLITPRVDGHPG